jgi:hypothetical protein
MVDDEHRTFNDEEFSDRVGPVLQAGDRAFAVVDAIRELNQDVEVFDRGAYLRVLVPRTCVVTRAAIERRLGDVFAMPDDLEQIMPSFKGELELSDDGASWSLAAAKRS